MIRITVMGRQQIKLLNRRNNALHRKVHIENAQKIREDAEFFKYRMEEMTIATFGYLSDHVKSEIEDTYNNMLAEAIAKENSKCMG